MEMTVLTESRRIKFRWVEEESYQALKRQASIDSVTGLFNRRYFDQCLAAVSHKDCYSVVFCDVDNFKEINDSYGHRAGDWVLLRIARLISALAGHNDVPARIGGDEFCILLPEKNAAQAAYIAEEMRHAVQADRFSFNEGERYPVSMSFGCASFPEHGSTAARILHQADCALYRSKTSGKNRVTVAEIERR